MHHGSHSIRRGALCVELQTPTFGFITKIQSIQLEATLVPKRGQCFGL